jgi:hypothetical protein
MVSGSDLRTMCRAVELAVHCSRSVQFNASAAAASFRLAQSLCIRLRRFVRRRLHLD